MTNIRGKIIKVFYILAILCVIHCKSKVFDISLLMLQSDVCIRLRLWHLIEFSCFYCAWNLLSQMLHDQYEIQVRGSCDGWGLLNICITVLIFKSCENTETCYISLENCHSKETMGRPEGSYFITLWHLNLNFWVVFYINHTKSNKLVQKQLIGKNGGSVLLPSL